MFLKLMSNVKNIENKSIILKTTRQNYNLDFKNQWLITDSSYTVLILDF